MILFFDEDMGTEIPKFLYRIGLKQVRWLLGTRPFYQGAADVEWLSKVGREGWLAFSCNKDMLNVEHERDVIFSQQVGIVFLTSGQENLPNVLRLVLNKWSWLEDIDTNVARPFAYHLYPGGRTRRVL